MNETDWLAGTDALSLLTFLKENGLVTARKSQLFITAYVRCLLQDGSEARIQAVARMEEVAEGSGDFSSPADHFRCFMRATSDATAEIGADNVELHPGLVREVYGNPFRPASVDPAWRTPTVVWLAQAAYEERALPMGHLDTARLSVLSDALEDVGCTDEAILSHLRSPGPHVRGCWAVDRLLGKS